MTTVVQLVQDTATMETEYRKIKSSDFSPNLLHAERRQDGKNVIIKVGRAGLVDREVLNALQTVEAEGSAKEALLCRIYEEKTCGNVHFTIMEDLNGGDLHTFFQESRLRADLAWRQHFARSVTFQLENVCLLQSYVPAEVQKKGPESFKVKLIDFDTVVKGNTKAEVLVGTDCYIPPEAYSGEVTPAWDMWSVGVLLYVMVFGCWPIPKSTFVSNGETTVDTIHHKEMQATQANLMAWRFKVPQVPTADAVAPLLRRLLEKDPQNRITVDQALADPYFAPLSSVENS